MARAPIHGKQRAQSHPQRHEPYSVDAPGSGRAVSVSKLKAAVRSAERYLRRDGLKADERVDGERRLESLRVQLADAERTQSKSAQGSNQPSTSLAGSATSSAGRINKPSKKGKERAATAKEVTVDGERSHTVKSKYDDRYKMLKHVEYVKTARRVKKAKRELAAATESLEAIADTDDKAKKKRKKASANVSAAEAALVAARVDAWYIATFPQNKKYVSLYPDGAYIEPSDYDLPEDFDPLNEADAVEQIPSVKEPDNVRSYWRAVVTSRLKAGSLTGEPVKSVKKGRQKPVANGLNLDNSNRADEVDEASLQGNDSLGELQLDAVEQAEVDEESDDFFA